MPHPADNPVIKVLLVEDDQEDYYLTRELFAEIQTRHFQVDWAKNFAQGCEALRARPYDVALVDYRLGPDNGLDLLQAAMKEGCEAPIIILTGQGEREVDLQAMAAGAADYLVKGRLDSGLLERSIRYAMERKRAARRAAAEQARLAGFGEAVGLALTRRDSLEDILDRCVTAMAQYLKASLGTIWVVDAEQGDMKLAASAGQSRPPDQAGKHPALGPQVEILSSRKPLLINEIKSDPRLPEKEWIKREDMAAYAGYPLVLEERVVGLMSMFSRVPLSESTLQEMASVANGIALCIDRKRSAQALDASEFKYRSVVENIKDVIFHINDAGKFTFLNPAWTEMSGFKTKDALGTPVMDYLHPDDRERHWDLFQQLIERKCSSCRHEMRFLARDGSFRWVEVYAQPMYQSNVLGASGTIRDITDRKQAEAEIQKLAAFVRLNPEPVTELAGDGTLTYLNPAARAMADTLGLKDPAGILPPEAASIAKECLRQGQSRLGEDLTINGQRLSWSLFPIITSQVVHCYGRDITERMNLEAQLRHAQKLESIGQLAAGVAHDFNNILTIIQGHADRLLGQYDGDRQVTEPLRLVSAAAKRGSSLTRQLLMFSRKQVMQSRIIDLNAVLANLTRLLHRLLGDDVALESNFPDNIPPVDADVGMIDQIIMNLSVNARDAMPKGGRLMIGTSNVDIDDAYVQQHPDARPGRFVCLTVSDTGSGMDRATLARIFEPFFTTKEVGKGTGLGLATVYGIVKQHQGWIEVNSREGAGTTFKVYFPASDKPIEVTPEKGPETTIRGGSETILVVEDEPVLRELARLILKDYKYDVLEASTGHEAIEVFEKHKGRIDLLLTDMVMPEGMTGRELAETLRRQKPSLKVIYTSGYSSDVMGQENAPRDIKFLQKPYPPLELAQVVRECLDVR
ncbi:MAG TPA: response regulator [Candidatus Binatia bacterium]|nr:response regulator [Candidatus Binatia bacterium]